MTPGRVARALLAFSAVAVGELHAQCPDGSPPPCRGASAVTQKRVVNPPLDEKTWIVVPFDNLSKTPDADWLRGAAVNLLYLDMSRWKDIHVIDDERVGDILREVPEVKADQPLSLSAGVAAAKRAGAGRLVMGDVLKLGNRTTVTAKIFDVKSGQRLRSVRDETAIADSVMPMFTRLARKVLEIAPPQGANLGAFGTTRMDAYHAYMQGVEALSRYDLAGAHKAFDDAIKLDSAFALAHYKQSIVIGWENPSDPTRRQRAEAANRLSSGLPPRERTLISGQLQQTRGEWTNACETYGSLVKQDSSDVEAWYGVGECLFHDPSLEAIGGDSSRMRFRADWARSIRAFDRVLQLDPTYHLAYQHIIDALTLEQHNQTCFLKNMQRRCYSGFLIRRGDSLVVNAVEVFTDTAALRQQGEEFVRTRSRRRNLDVAQFYAEAWTQASPNEPQAHRGLARIKTLQGKVSEADAELAAVKVRGTLSEELGEILERMEIAYKLGKGEAAASLFDSARTSNAPLPGSPFSFGNAIAGYGPAFGKVVGFDSLMTIGLRMGNAPDSVRRYAHQQLRGLLTGVMPDSTIALEAAVMRRPLPATRSPWPPLAYTLRAPRSVWPVIDTTVHDLKSVPAIALAQKDTAKLRRAAEALDSAAAALSAAGVSDTGFSVIAAESYLALHDSTAALQSLRYTLDAAMATTSYFPRSSSQLPPVFFIPRAMLLRADLAAAAKQTDEARTWYKRFIDVWSKADPEFQPIVERARKSLAALGGLAP